MLDNLLTCYKLSGTLDVGFLSYINNKVSTSHVKPWSGECLKWRSTISLVNTLQKYI